ncbi:MAG: transglycosylase domain-containing protein, partial [Patescibacteria group bacterium]
MPLPQLHEVRHSSHYPRKNLNHYLRKVIRRFVRRVILLGVAAGLLLGVYLVGAFAWYSRALPSPDKILERNIAESTKIYDREGKTVLYDVHGAEKRTLVKIDQIPDYVKWATISAEDKNFYLHHGFNLLAMFKGAIIDPLLGRGMRGGSTLTQQFVKNAILTNERKISRKIKEFILSYKIEKAFSKDEILQMYLNEIPYGSVSYGVQSASQTFFNKDVKDLTLGEAAILAALPKAPTFYSPFGSNKDRLFGRQQYVLDQMVENKYIDQATADKAKNEKIVFVAKNQSILAPHFVMYVKELLSNELGEEMLESGGLKVITTLDLKKQEIAEKAVTDGVDKRGKQYGFNNA